MGSAETRGEGRAIQAAQQALASPLLDNRDIMGAKKILLSIISGEEAELQMDELSQITEFIQEQSGDEAEVIFGHGVDANLGDRIRVTVIATGFQAEGKTTRKGEDKKVHELDKSQIPLFGPIDNSVNQRNDDLVLKVRQPEPEVSDKPILREEAEPDEGAIFVPITKSGIPVEEPRPNRFENDSPQFPRFSDQEEEGEEGLFGSQDDEFDIGRELTADQVLNEEGLLEVRRTKERLEQQAKDRRDKLKAAKKTEMSKEEFHEKWTLPAYLRRGVKMDNVPHSSEPYISRYNLNDDNSLLGNNKFLHDNVD
jgi:cell division protein FtsZ